MQLIVSYYEPRTRQIALQNCIPLNQPDTQTICFHTPNIAHKHLAAFGVAKQSLWEKYSKQLLERTFSTYANYYRMWTSGLVGYREANRTIRQPPCPGGLAGVGAVHTRRPQQGTRLCGTLYQSRILAIPSSCYLLSSFYPAIWCQVVPLFHC